MSLSADQLFGAGRCMGRPFLHRHHGWFVGFAPVEKPEIIVAVLAEHSCSGSGGAAPLAHDVILSFMRKFHPDWLEPKEKKGKSGVTDENAGGRQDDFQED